jgi:hypothetical protein
VFLGYEALRDAAAEAWRAVRLDPEKVPTICAAPYPAERRWLFFSVLAEAAGPIPGSGLDLCERSAMIDAVRKTGESGLI